MHPKGNMPSCEDLVDSTRDTLWDRLQHLCKGEQPDFTVDTHKGRIEFLFPLNTCTSHVPVMQAVCEEVKRHETNPNEVFLSILKEKFLVIRVRDNAPKYSRGGQGEQGGTAYRMEVMLPMAGKGTGMVVVTATEFKEEGDVDLMERIYSIAGGHTKVLTKAEKEKEEKEEKEANMTRAEIVEKLQLLGVDVVLPATDEDEEELPEGAWRRPSEKAEALWDGVAGYEEVKAAVKQSITLPLIRPDLFALMGKLTRGKAGSKSTSGVLFTGPPGVGKTCMAKVASHVASTPLVYVPVESVVSKWYGEAEQKLKSVFETTRKLGNAVLFLDELDAFAGSRDGDMHEVTRRILSVLLRNLDGLENDQDEGKARHIVLVGATNRPGDLDPALRSRFNKMVEFPLPDAPTRAKIFGTYATTLDVQELEALALSSEGFAGRDIRECCDDAEHLHVAQLLSEAAFDVTLTDLQPPALDSYQEAILSRRMK